MSDRIELSVPTFPRYFPLLVLAVMAVAVLAILPVALGKGEYQVLLFPLVLGYIGFLFISAPHQIIADREGITFRLMYREVTVPYSSLNMIKGEPSMVSFHTSVGTFKTWNQLTGLHLFIARAKERNPLLRVEGC